MKCPKCKAEIDHVTEHKEYGHIRLVTVKNGELKPYEEEDNLFWYTDNPEFECTHCDRIIALSYQELIGLEWD